MAGSRGRRRSGLVSTDDPHANGPAPIVPWEMTRCPDVSRRVAESDECAVVVGCFDSLVRPGLTGAQCEDRHVRVLLRDVQSADLEAIVVAHTPRVAIFERLGEIAPPTGVLILARSILSAGTDRSSSGPIPARRRARV